MKKNWAVILLIVLLAVGSLLAGTMYYEYNSALPVDAKATFVGGATCIQCHQKEHGMFTGSHHDRAMDVATDETVLADFDGTKIEHFGITSTVFKSDGRFMVNTEGPDGTMQDFEVTMVFGYEPLQQYMVELKPPGEPGSHGQYQVLRLSWDVEKEEWFYLMPPDVDEKLSPGDPLHWTGVTQRWNSNCAACHSTNLQKKFDVLTGKYSTTFTDIDVNCEACHGPGSLHVQIAENRRFFWDKNHVFGLAKLKTTSNLPQVEACAPCHSRRSEICSGHQAGKRFDDHYSCQLLSDRIYHDDGQIRDEDYVYGSFIQSKMFHQGIKCTDCHDPHSARVKFDDNQLCTSCHQHPAGKYDTPSHHRHKVGSEGARCVECHMPATTYMAIDSRRDHSIRVPRPDLSLEFGTPNACSACHIDKQRLPEVERGKLKQYLDWIDASENGNSVVQAELDRVNLAMADAFKEWYPESATNNKRSKYYERLAAGKSNLAESRDSLISVSKDAKAPGIFRASAIEAILFEDASSVNNEFLAEVLADDDPKVVASSLVLISERIQLILGLFDGSGNSTELNRGIARQIKYVGPFLEHESRQVRIAAARTISQIPNRIRANGSFSSSAYQAALSEYIDSLRINSDLAASHMTLASIYEADMQWDRAEDAYRNAIAVEPNFAGPRTNLAALLDQKAEQIRTQIIQSPNSSANVDLGSTIDKLVAQANRLRVEENGLLKIEVTRVEDLPQAHGLFYRYGLSCYLMKDLESAEKYLKKAVTLSPDSERYLLALATFYKEMEDYEAALPLINRLIELNGTNAGFKRLRDDVLNSRR